MPLVLLHNVPRGEWSGERPASVSQRLNLNKIGVVVLAMQLRQAFFNAKIPGIEKRSWITVAVGSRQILDDDNTFIIKVEGMFDTPERTTAERERLADVLLDAAKSCFDDRKIEVIIDAPFDRNISVFRKYEPE